eukprot:594166-Prymnesium_polylepis.1
MPCGQVPESLHAVPVRRSSARRGAGRTGRRGAFERAADERRRPARRPGWRRDAAAVAANVRLRARVAREGGRRDEQVTVYTQRWVHVFVFWPFVVPTDDCREL